MLIPGSCHCGNIAFNLLWRPDPVEIPARACTCSFCVRHGGVWTACPAGKLSVTIKNPARVSCYNFETRTADFHVCTICGVVPLATSRIDGKLHAVINVNAFEGEARRLLKPSSVSFDDEDMQSRVARRTHNWIADVRFVDNDV